MLTIVSIVITEPIYYQFVFLFMKSTLQQYGKELHNVEVKKKKQSESNETRTTEILSKYFIWLVNNNIKEFQIFYKFWNQKFTTQSLFF